MTDLTSTETAIARLIDESAIRDTILRFADAATRGDFDAFRAVWADDAEWVIGGTDGQPFERRAEGIDAIVALFRTLWEGQEYFIHFVIPGAVEIDGDVATVRSMCHESARGSGEHYYRTNGVWTDTFRRSGDGWVFSRRAYEYMWLDFSPYSGDISWTGTSA